MTTMVFVDIEALGTSPINGTMTEFGAVALNKDNTAIRDTFHGVLVEAEPDKDNPAVPYIHDDAKHYDGRKVMTKFSDWLHNINDRVVFVSDNNGYDFMWIACEFDRYGIKNPFGHSSRRISDFWAGLNTDWKNTQKWKSLRTTVHDHNPVNDSLGNAEAWLKMMELTKNGE